MTDVQARPRVKLQPSQHRIVRLYIANLSAQDIADILGIKPGTVRSQLREIRRRLRATGYRCENRIYLEKSYRHEYDY